MRSSVSILNSYETIFKLYITPFVLNDTTSSITSRLKLVFYIICKFSQNVIDGQHQTSRNTPSTTNLEEEEIVDALGNAGNASMPEQVNRPNPWRKKMMRMMINVYLEF